MLAAAARDSQDSERQGMLTMKPKCRNELDIADRCVADGRPWRGIRILEAAILSDRSCDKSVERSVMLRRLEDLQILYPEWQFGQLNEEARCVLDGIPGNEMEGAPWRSIWRLRGLLDKREWIGEKAFELRKTLIDALRTLEETHPHWALDQAKSDLARATKMARDYHKDDPHGWRAVAMLILCVASSAIAVWTFTDVTTFLFALRSSWFKATTVVIFLVLNATVITLGGCSSYANRNFFFFFVWWVVAIGGLDKAVSSVWGVDASTIGVKNFATFVCVACANFVAPWSLFLAYNDMRAARESCEFNSHLNAKVEARRYTLKLLEAGTVPWKCRRS